MKRWRVVQNTDRLVCDREVEANTAAEALSKAGIFVEEVGESRKVAGGVVHVHPIELRYNVTFQMDHIQVSLPFDWNDRRWLIEKLGGWVK